MYVLIPWLFSGLCLLPVKIESDDTNQDRCDGDDYYQHSRIEPVGDLQDDVDRTVTKNKWSGSEGTSIIVSPDFDTSSKVMCDS